MTCEKCLFLNLIKRKWYADESEQNLWHQVSNQLTKNFTTANRTHDVIGKYLA
jgi:hypothetical protein